MSYSFCYFALGALCCDLSYCLLYYFIVSSASAPPPNPSPLGSCSCGTPSAASIPSYNFSCAYRVFNTLACVFTSRHACATLTCYFYVVLFTIRHDFVLYVCMHVFGMWRRFASFLLFTLLCIFCNVAIHPAPPPRSCRVLPPARCPRCAAPPMALAPATFVLC